MHHDEVLVLRPVASQLRVEHDRLGEGLAPGRIPSLDPQPADSGAFEIDDPVVKGQTAASSYKPAMLSNGVKTLVPPFVESGERIVVRTEDASYVERAKG